MLFAGHIAVAISVLLMALGTGNAQALDIGCDALVVDVNVAGSRVGETVSPDDVYIAPLMPLELGPGRVFRIFRPAEIRDERFGQHPLRHYIGRIQIIDMQENILVGRMLESASRQDYPRPRYEAVMLGDCLELEPPFGDAAEQGPFPSGILFRFDSSEIDEQWEGNLKELARFIWARSPAKVIVEGHADWIGTDAYNVALSRRRARAVVDSLVRRYGFAADLFIIEAYGESRPETSNETSAGRRKNRRAVPTVLFRIVPSRALPVPLSSE